MKCAKCKQVLPDDSVFCQYCGTKIETDKNERNEHNMNYSDSEKILKEIFKLQAEETAKAWKENSNNQPNNEDDADFGVVPEKPIYTLASKMVEGEKEYLERLLTSDGEALSWVRRGSVCAEGVSGMIDIYDGFLPSGNLYKTIYINMYGAKASSGVPKGFILREGKKENSPHCIKKQEEKIKEITKRIRVPKIAIILIVVVVALSALNVVQLVNRQDLQSQITELEKESALKTSRITTLNNENSSLQSTVWEYTHLVNFIDDYVVFVENDGTNLYHKFDSYRFKENSFWVYNIEAAKNQGYYACPVCH